DTGKFTTTQRPSTTRLKYRTAASPRYVRCALPHVELRCAPSSSSKSICLSSTDGSVSGLRASDGPLGGPTRESDEVGLQPVIVAQVAAKTPQMMPIRS